MPTGALEITKSGAALVQQAGIMGSGITWPMVFLGTLNLLLGGVLVAVVKNVPLLRKIAADRATSLDDERKEDMVAMRERMGKLEERVENAQAKAQAAENKLVAAVSAIALLSAEVRRLDPHGQSPVLNQVQDLLAAATTGDLGVGAGLGRVATARHRHDGKG